MIGTPYFLAPEAIGGKSSIEGDLWSLGVLIFVLLTGSYPFSGDTPSEILNSIDTQRDYIFDLPVFKGISPQCIELMDGLIQIDPKKRIQVFDALSHPTFNRIGEIRKKNLLTSKKYKSRNQSSIDVVIKGVV